MGNKNSGLKNFIIPFTNSEESMYWLGYLSADGNVQYSKKFRVYKVSLFSKDKEIIDKFMNFIGKRCKYHLRKQNGIHEAYISSIQLCKYLIKLGITPKKSLTLDIKFPLNKHFLRGYFDGDGSIRKNKKESKFTSGSKIHIDKICNYLDNLNIYYKVRQKQNAYDICIERAKENEKLLNHLYKDSNIYLERKFKQYVALYGNI